MYIKFDENGVYGFYTPEIHGEEFCKNECIKIADEFYKYLLENQGKYLIDVEAVVDTVSKKNLIERPKEPIEVNPMPSLEERLQTAEDTILYLLMNGGM